MEQIRARRREEVGLTWMDPKYWAVCLCFQQCVKLGKAELGYIWK